MQKINNINISFNGINSHPVIDNNLKASNSVITELGEKALPACDKSLAMSSSLPSELINDTDVSRYKMVQAEWVKTIAKNSGISFENLAARLPEIKIGDAKVMLAAGNLAQFKSVTNTVEINPVREIANLSGGDELKIVHESSHGILRNLRRAWAKQLQPEQLYQEVANVVMNKMIQGEHGFIIKGFEPKTIDEKVIWTPELMNVPVLSEKERFALVETLNRLKDEHLDFNTAKLNESGKKFVKENLLSCITDYPRLISNESDKSDETILKKMTDYIDAFYARRNLLIGDLISPEAVDSEQNLKTPLTEIEHKMAMNSLSGLLSLQEGNYIRQLDIAGVSDNSLKSYFMSYEELLARSEENAYRKGKVEQKISDIKNKGINPSDILLKERQVVENNSKLLSLTEEIRGIEKQIVGSSKSAEKIGEVNNIKQKIIQLIDSIDPKIDKYINMDVLIAYDIPSGVFNKEVEENVPPELKNVAMKLFDAAKKIKVLNKSYNKLNSPENFLTDTPENISLKSKFDNLMSSIKKLSSECDLIGIPKTFFNSDVDYFKANEKIIECFQKWSKRIP